MLRGFLRDRRNQLTLGVFTATFVYALMVLREVPGEEGLTGRFVPGIAISVAFMFAVLSVALLVAHIHHITQSIRVVNIIGRIGDETEAAIDRVHPVDLESRPLPAEPTDEPRVISALDAGVVTVVEQERLVTLAERARAALRLVPRVGEFVPRGAPLLLVWGGNLTDGEARRAVQLDRERNARHDVAFGFRQLVDIAERALSPGVNDPTTAVQCLDQIHHLLRQLVLRPYPNGVYADGRTPGTAPASGGPARSPDEGLARGRASRRGAGEPRRRRRGRGHLTTNGFAFLAPPEGGRHGGMQKAAGCVPPLRRSSDGILGPQGRRDRTVAGTQEGRYRIPGSSRGTPSYLKGGRLDH